MHTHRGQEELEDVVEVTIHDTSGVRDSSRPHPGTDGRSNQPIAGKAVVEDGGDHREASRGFDSAARRDDPPRGSKHRSKEESIDVFACDFDNVPNAEDGDDVTAKTG